MTPWTYSENHIRLRFWIVVGYLTVVLVLCAFGLWKIQDQQEQLHRNAVQFANKICVSSNAARQSLYDLLVFAEDRIKQQVKQGKVPSDQAQDALDFYNNAKSRIKFTECPPKQEAGNTQNTPPSNPPPS